MSIAVVALALGLVAAGCGSDDGSKSSAGAPPSASGSAAGGFAPEAGKKRPQKEIDEEKKNYGSEPPPIQLQTSEKSGYNVSKPSVFIVQSNAELKKLQKKLKAKGVETGVAPVDFPSRQVVAVVFPKGKPGVLLQITQVNETGGKIEVNAVKITPGKGCKTSPTNPFALVETRAMKGTPTLKLTTLPNNPC